MPANDMNLSEVMGILQKLEEVPVVKFEPILSDGDRMNTICERVYGPIAGRRTHLNADDTKTLFGISKLDDISELKAKDPHDLLCRVIAYYMGRINMTPPKNRGEHREALHCLGMGDDGMNWVIQTCQDAGAYIKDYSTAEPKPQSKTDAQKKAERIQKHKTGVLPEQPKPKPSPVKQDEAPTDTEIPLSVISPECFWDYQSACEVIQAEPEPYLIEGLFRKGTINIIGATQNAGKTTLLFDIMGSVASGSNFLTKPDRTGGFQTHKGACILLDFEGDKVDTASRLRATVDTYSEVSGLEPKDIPVLVRYMPIDWTGSDDKFPEKVFKAISALPDPYNKPAIIGFDTYSAFSDVENENESTQAQKVFNRLKKLKTLFHDEVTTFVTMHLRKLNDKSFENVTMDDLRGTSASAGAGSDIWFLSEVKGQPTTKKLKQVKAKGRSRSDEIKTLSLAYDSNNDGTYSRVRFFMVEGTDEAEAQEKQTLRKQKNEAKREKEVLAFIATHPNCSLNRICKGDKDGQDRLQMNIQTCKPLVDRLISEGKVYNLSDSDNSYSLVINPRHKEESDN